MSTVAERVARGAALLDEKLPGWDERISLAELELSSCYRCILGQLFARSPRTLDDNPYGIGLGALGVSVARWYGFDGPDTGELTAEWRRLITARRLARVPAEATP